MYVVVSNGYGLTPWHIPICMCTYTNNVKIRHHPQFLGKCIEGRRREKPIRAHLLSPTNKESKVQEIGQDQDNTHWGRMFHEIIFISIF